LRSRPACSPGTAPPRNLEAARALDAAVRAEGATPAWVAIDAGVVRAGLSMAELDHLAMPGVAVAKVARRDYPAVLASGGLGATTVSATLWAAAQLGIEVMCTGGIGGVHRAPAMCRPTCWSWRACRPRRLLRAESIVDPARPRTSRGTWRARGWLSTSRLPFFLARDAGLALEHRADSALEAAPWREPAAGWASPRPCSSATRAGRPRARRGSGCRRGDRVRAARESRRCLRQGRDPFLLRCLAE